MSRTERETFPPFPEPLPVPVVDNHCHLNITRDGSPPVDVQDAIDAAAFVGVDRMVQIGCDRESAQWTVDTVIEHEELLGGVALHPNEVPIHAEMDELDEVLEEIENLSRHDRIRVIGETGLDYFRTGPEGIAIQQEAFRWHIELAKRTDKALQIHDRDAHADVLRILAEEGAPEKTVLHCFSGDVEMARECVERGYYLSFSGTVSFKNAQPLRGAMAVVPPHQLLVETDAPYLTPHPHRGAPNAPYLVPLTVRAMASSLDMDVVDLCKAICDNSTRVYGQW
ncbi:TatD family hydrolase [Ornithinimicrobium sp. INDO-MA30-4]|uniref:TatD family hydrolase n=1 Tax=Ornithinimicrobium sp. INDO-MA30-4 TaxID=2908651 RepID=UPI001F439256|nr:TatD family hydrolase [Ornithinimicrobium sp. INDO-MA30-4]UJH70586.1 TatD family hydrolase [Ornithinimicrobium sp. INDO-MA30-4]